MLLRSWVGTMPTHQHAATPAEVTDPVCGITDPSADAAGHISYRDEDEHPLRHHKLPLAVQREGRPTLSARAQGPAPAPHRAWHQTHANTRARCTRRSCAVGPGLPDLRHGARAGRSIARRRRRIPSCATCRGGSGSPPCSASRCSCWRWRDDRPGAACRGAAPCARAGLSSRSPRPCAWAGWPFFVRAVAVARAPQPRTCSR